VTPARPALLHWFSVSSEENVMSFAIASAAMNGPIEATA